MLILQLGKLGAQDDFYSAWPSRLLETSNILVACPKSQICLRVHSTCAETIWFTTRLGSGLKHFRSELARTFKPPSSILLSVIVLICVHCFLLQEMVLVEYSSLFIRDMSTNQDVILAEPNLVVASYGLAEPRLVVASYMRQRAHFDWKLCFRDDCGKYISSRFDGTKLRRRSYFH